MATSSFDKTIVIRKKEAAELLLNHLKKQSDKPATERPAIKMASKESLAKKERLC